MQLIKAIITGGVIAAVQILGIAIFEVTPNEMGKFLLLLIGINTIIVYGVTDYYYKTKGVTIRLDCQPMDSTLQIANETLPYLRRGLNNETALKTAEIIFRICDVEAVAITDTEKVLAFLGAGCEIHKPGTPIRTYATRQVIKSGKLKIVEDQQNLMCSQKDCQCPLEAAVIVPLKNGNKVAGTIKLYHTKQGMISQEVIRQAVGIAQLLDVQMELAELNRQAQLVTEAELQALHAQINPHFLFNALNTIIMFSRTNPDMARDLLIRLAGFFRHALKKHGLFNTLEEEMEYIDTYLDLEKARFRDKLVIVKNIDAGLLKYQVPALTIQPLVENAVKHGITTKVGRGTVEINANLKGDQLEIVVKDDGIGIKKQNLSKIFKRGYGDGNGVGLYNVNERLKSLYGEGYWLEIISEFGKGTQVFLRVPMLSEYKRGEAVNEAESTYS